MFLKTSKGDCFDPDGLAAILAKGDGRGAYTVLIYKAGGKVKIAARRQDVVALIEAYEAGTAGTAVTAGKCMTDMKFMFVTPEERAAYVRDHPETPSKDSDDADPAGPEGGE